MKRLSVPRTALLTGLILLFGAALFSCSTPKTPPNFDTLAKGDSCAASWNLRYEQLVGDGCYQKRVVRAARRGCAAGGTEASTNCKVARMLERTSRDAQKSLTAAQLDQALAAGCEAGDGDGCALVGRMRLQDNPEQALAFFSRGCEKGSAASCLELRSFYEVRQAVASDKHAALLENEQTECGAQDTACYERACRHGRASACTKLAALLQQGEDAENQTTRAFDTLERACAMGDWVGCAELGRFYEQGRVVPRSFKTARRLFEWGCAPANPSACVAAGRMFAEGLGGSRDRERAQTMYSGACASQNAVGCRRAADLVAKANSAKATELFSKACELGDGQSCVRLAHLKIDNQSGQGSRDTQIAALYHSACDAGYTDGCSEGAQRFRDGDGVAADERTGAELAAKACELGSTTHCWAAADAYRFGYSVEVDRKKATRFTELSIARYTKDCQNGDARACHHAAHAIAHGYPEKKRLEEAQAFLERSCNEGAEGACSEIAVQYVTGEIFSVDRDRGIELMAKRCDKIDAYMCSRLAHELTEGAENEAELARAATLHRTNCRWKDDAAACAMYGRHLMRGQGLEKDLEDAYLNAARGCDDSEEEFEGCPVAAQAALRRQPQDVESLAETFEKICVHEGQPVACESFGRILETGWGLERDVYRALSLYETACDADEQFSPQACSRAKIVSAAISKEDDEAASPDALQKACEKGDADSCVLLARHHEFGSLAPERFEPARQNYRKACALGHADACAVYAALAYEDGEPVGRKFQDEILWACELGTAEMCMTWGWKISWHNWKRGVALYQHACAKGSKDACRRLQENLEPKTAPADTTDGAQ